MSSDNLNPSASGSSAGSSARGSHVLGCASLGFSDPGSLASVVPVPRSARSGSAGSGSVDSLRSGSSDPATADPGPFALTPGRFRLTSRDRLLLVLAGRALPAVHARRSRRALFDQPAHRAAAPDHPAPARRPAPLRLPQRRAHRRAVPVHPRPARAAAAPRRLPRPRQAGAPRRRAAAIERARRIIASATAAHLLGVNQFFIDLHAAQPRPTPAAPGCARLVRWWSEQHATDDYAQPTSTPTGTASGTPAGATVGFFLEHDRGTEDLATGRRQAARLRTGSPSSAPATRSCCGCPTAAPRGQPAPRLLARCAHPDAGRHRRARPGPGRAGLDTHHRRGGLSRPPPAAARTAVRPRTPLRHQPRPLRALTASAASPAGAWGRCPVTAQVNAPEVTGDAGSRSVTVRPQDHL